MGGARCFLVVVVVFCWPGLSLGVPHKIWSLVVKTRQDMMCHVNYMCRSVEVAFQSRSPMGKRQACVEAFCLYAMAKKRQKNPDGPSDSSRMSLVVSRFGGLVWGCEKNHPVIRWVSPSLYSQSTGVDIWTLVFLRFVADTRIQQRARELRWLQRKTDCPKDLLGLGCKPTQIRESGGRGHLTKRGFSKGPIFFGWLKGNQKKP